MRNRKSQRRQAGFTLIEVLVAFAILGLASGAILSVFSSSPGKISLAENKRMAALAAQSTLALVGNERPIETGEWQGESDTNIHWKLSIKPYNPSANVPAPTSDTTVPISVPYLVTVHVEAGKGWNAGVADIETVRLKVAAP